MIFYEVSEFLPSKYSIAKSVSGICAFFGPRGTSAPDLRQISQMGYPVVISRRIATSTQEIYSDQVAGATHSVINVSTLSKESVYSLKASCEYVGITPVFEAHTKQEIGFASSLDGITLVNRSDIFTGIVNLDATIIASPILKGKAFWTCGAIGSIDSIMLAKECGASAVIVGESLRYRHFAEGVWNEH